jgi:hypothetical protein
MQNVHNANIEIKMTKFWFWGNPLISKQVTENIIFFAINWTKELTLPEVSKI